MKYRIFLTCTFIFLILFSRVNINAKCNDSIPTIEQSDALKILSWNIFMLPTYFFESEYKYRRAYGIAEKIKKSIIIL